MPRRKKTGLQGLADGWRGIISETADKFRQKDAEGFRRLDALGCRLSRRKKHGLFGSLGRIAFEPMAARTNLGADLLAAFAEEFEATLNFLEHCRGRFLKMATEERGRAELALSGMMTAHSLAEAGKDDLPWNKVHELIALDPPLTPRGVKNARDEIMRRRKARKRRI